MTKKHFIHLACVLKNMKPDGRGIYCQEEIDRYETRYNQWEETCIQLADFCSNYNPNFDRYKFLRECGVDND